MKVCGMSPKWTFAKSSP